MSKGTTGTAREAIVDAVGRIVERREPDLPSVVDIAREAGVSRPTVYAHFATNEAAFEAVVDRVRDEALAIQENADTTSVEATYASTLRAILDLQARHVGLFAMLAAHAGSDDHMARRWHDVHDRSLRRHARFIDRLAEAGHARPAASSLAIAEAVDGASIRFAQLIAEDPSRRDVLAAELVALQSRLLGLDGD